MAGLLMDAFAAADGPKRPPGLQLAWRNRRVLAKQLHWPDGVLEECERLDTAYPDWSIAWLGAVPGREAGYWAVRDPDSGRRMDIHCADPGLLAEAIENAPPPNDWRMRQVIPRRA